jgi:hypothetical protein
MCWSCQVETCSEHEECTSSLVWDMATVLPVVEPRVQSHYFLDWPCKVHHDFRSEENLVGLVCPLHTQETFFWSLPSSCLFRLSGLIFSAWCCVFLQGAWLWQCTRGLRFCGLQCCVSVQVASLKHQEPLPKQQHYIPWDLNAVYKCCCWQHFKSENDAETVWWWHICVHSLQWWGAADVKFGLSCSCW